MAKLSLVENIENAPLDFERSQPIEPLGEANNVAAEHDYIPKQITM